MKGAVHIGKIVEPDYNPSWKGKVIDVDADGNNFFFTIQIFEKSGSPADEVTVRYWRYLKIL